MTDLSRRMMLVRTLLAGLLGGLIDSTRNAFGNTAHYVYDERGRLVQVAYSDGTNIIYTYDDAGNRTRVVAGPTSAIADGTIVFESNTPGDWRWICTRTQNYEVRVWGAGSGGGGCILEGSEKDGGPQFIFWGGGSGGGYAARQYTIEFGDVLSGRVGAGGGPGGWGTWTAPPFGQDGSEPTTLSTFQATSLIANPGYWGMASIGGSASGGTTNISGRAGGLTNYTDGGGAGNGGGDQTGPAADGTTPGGGGATGGSGAPGRVQIIAR